MICNLDQPHWPILQFFLHFIRIIYVGATLMSQDDLPTDEWLHRWSHVGVSALLIILWLLYVGFTKFVLYFYCSYGIFCWTSAMRDNSKLSCSDLCLTYGVCIMFGVEFELAFELMWLHWVGNWVIHVYVFWTYLNLLDLILSFALGYEFCIWLWVFDFNCD